MGAVSYVRCRPTCNLPGLKVVVDGSLMPVHSPLVRGGSDPSAPDGEKKGCDVGQYS
jgi:hypothetical protein